MDDRFRIDLEGSRTHDGSPLTKIEVVPFVDAEAITVFDLQNEKDSLFLDWQYSTFGEKVLKVKFIHGDDVREIEKTIKVLSKADEKLFSDDEMLEVREANIRTLLPEGRSSFIFVHRLAQTEILKELSFMGCKVKAEDILDMDDVQRWSTFKALSLIFESNITSVQDVHTAKKATYIKLATDAGAKAVVKLDRNQDGKADTQTSTIPTMLRRG